MIKRLSNANTMITKQINSIDGRISNVNKESVKSEIKLTEDCLSELGLKI